MGSPLKLAGCEFGAACSSPQYFILLVWAIISGGPSELWALRALYDRSASKGDAQVVGIGVVSLLAAVLIGPLGQAMRASFEAGQIVNEQSRETPTVKSQSHQTSDEDPED